MNTEDPLAVQIVLLVILVIVNAIFAAAEMAIVSSNRYKITSFADKGNKRAVLLLKLLDEPNTMLSTIQVVITLAGFLASASASISMSDNLGGVISSIGIPYGNQIAVVIITLLLSYITLVFGELYPKRIALAHSETIALALVKLIIVISKITKPFVWFLSISVEIVLKITGQGKETDGNSFSEEEVISMLAAGKESGAIKEEGTDMIQSIFAFDDKLAYEIMTPRRDVFVIDLEDAPDEYLDQLMKLKYSRIPVCEGDVDHIVGVIYIKDYLIQARINGFDSVDLRTIMRKPYFVPETKNIDDLFFALKESKNHIAILIDEYGGFSGIVTMEDIIEQVMGEIIDEYDDEEGPEIECLEDGTIIAAGSTTLHDLMDETGIELASENSDTIGGYIYNKLGDILPDEEMTGLTLTYGDVEIEVQNASEHQIRKVKIRKISQ